jgi:hypothetical protein
VLSAVVLACIGWLAACSAPSPAPENIGAEPDNVAATAPAAAKPAPPPKPFSVKETTPLLEFAYSYPAEAAAIPAIAQQFQADLQKGKAEATGEAREDKAGREKDGFPYMAHSLQTDWKTHANTPQFLALLSERYFYTGGAHGMTGYDSLLWDRGAGKAIPFTSVMVSPSQFAGAIHDRFCNALDAARAKKRGEPVVRSGQDDFTVCVDPMKQALVPESKTGKAIDGITVVIGPYEAGPYAEGSYDIPLSVDGAMLKAIKPEYRSAFSAVR